MKSKQIVFLHYPIGPGRGNCVCSRWTPWGDSYRYALKMRWLQMWVKNGEACTVEDITFMLMLDAWEEEAIQAINGIG